MQKQKLNSLKMDDIPMAESGLFELETSPEIADQDKAFITSQNESHPNVHKSSGKVQLNNSSHHKANEDYETIEEADNESSKTSSQKVDSSIKTNAMSEYSVIKLNPEEKSQENSPSIQKEEVVEEHKEQREDVQEENTGCLPDVNMAESGEFDLESEREEEQKANENSSEKQAELPVKEETKEKIKETTTEEKQDKIHEEIKKSQDQSSKDKLHSQVQLTESEMVNNIQMSTQMSEIEEQPLSTPKQVLQQITFDDIPMADSGFLGSNILGNSVETNIVQQQPTNLNQISEVQEPNYSSEMSKGNSNSIQSSFKGNSIQDSSKIEEETKVNEKSQAPMNTSTPTPIPDEDIPLETNGFAFELELKDDGLEIEAENKHTNQVYKFMLTKEFIFESTNELFDSPGDIKEIIEDAFRNKKSNVEVMINENAFVTVKWKGKIGETEKVSTLLMVQLVDQQENPLQTSQRLHKKASRNLTTSFERGICNMTKILMDYSHTLTVQLNEALQKVEELERREKEVC